MYAKGEDDPEQCRILRQLKTKFPSTPHWQIREVCRENNWRLSSCIDQLMKKFSNESYNMEDIIAHQHLKESRNEGQKCKHEERIGSLINKGYRVMILMRGPPGVGKSHLARSLINKFVDFEIENNYNTQDFICSTDDYFYNSHGVYKYDSTLISDAHEFNYQRVKDKATSGLSPIIVDNTNIKLWEMLPYVKCAVQNNYLIEVLEPKTSWSKSCSILAQKNEHGVPRHRIQQMMEVYEKGTVADLIKMLKNTKYSKTLPQMRSLPPFHIAEAGNISLKEELVEKKSHQGNWTTFTTTAPKEQRTIFKSTRSPSNLQHDTFSAFSPCNVYSLSKEKPTNAWEPFESESAEFWGIKSSNPQAQQNLQMKNLSEGASGTKSLLNLLREENDRPKNELQSIQNYDNEIRSVSSFERHTIDCANEEESFVALRQIYPNKRVSGLWDLFVKCNGDVDWAVDILLKEDELERTRTDDNIIYQPEDDELFECNCNNGDTIRNERKINNEFNINNSKMSEGKIICNTADAKPQRQRSHFLRSKQYANESLLEIKENIENCFVFGDDQYSQNLLKIKNIRSGTNEVKVSSNNMTEIYENVVDNQIMNYEPDGNDMNEYEDKENDENEDMLEMSLGEQVVKQLVEIFKNESSLENISSTLPLDLKVFMPKSLAKQLYMLWVESALNHMEEERQKIVKEDEDFARLLKNPKYSEYKQSPNNLHEILDMEYAWKIYNQEKYQQQQRDTEKERSYTPTDLATHLTQLKLCDSFPDIPRETLLDILATNNNDYKTTINFLHNTMKIDNISTTQEYLIKCAQQEQEVINQEFRNEVEIREERLYNNWDESEQRVNISPDEAKRLALREFEESRNLAAHHCQLKAECYQKAKEAIRSGNGGAAIYYSQIANLHIKKIDIYNHRAANCIMDVHKNTQNNPDLLDLHYLFLVEALGCLDLFLDRHITGLRLQSRNYKHVFVITGRGKHSAGGVSTIKNKVKARLKERCLRWSEVNPGLLKVKLFSGSRHSKNI